MRKNIFYSDAFEDNVMAITLNSDKNIIYATNAINRAFGYKSGELINVNFLKLTSPSEDIEIIFLNTDSNKKFPISIINKYNKHVKVNISISENKEENEYYLVLYDLQVEQINKSSSEFEMALNESENRKDFLHTIFNEQKSIVIVIHMNMIIDANRSFLNFFKVPSLEYYLDNNSNCISNVFERDDDKEYLQKKIFGQEWTDYILDNPDEIHKVLIKGKIFEVHIVKINQGDDELFIATFNDITSSEKAQNYIEDSIEYASLIQHSLVPDNEVFRKYVDEYFVIWHPKDVVGGDIYLLEELRHDDEMILFVIDCAGHGVPGAFVTMLVKAIERQIVGHILNTDDDEPVSPAQLLGVFNRSMKNLLKQESSDSISNAGFDGGILYYNKRENHLIFAGAKTPLFVMQDGKLEIISGDRHSIGYKRSKRNYSFTDHTIDLKTDTTIYLSTDGYMDQQGEETLMPFGKKKVASLINEYSQETLSDQQEVFLDEFMEHRGDRVSNDDVTMVALKFLSNKEKK